MCYGIYELTFPCRYCLPKGESSIFKRIRIKIIWNWIVLSVTYNCIDAIFNPHTLADGCNSILDGRTRQHSWTIFLVLLYLLFNFVCWELFWASAWQCNFRCKVNHGYDASSNPTFYLIQWILQEQEWSACMALLDWVLVSN